MSAAGTPLTRSQWALGLALGATVAACLWAAQLPEAEDDAAALATVPARRRPSTAVSSPSASSSAPLSRWAVAAREPWPEAEPAALAAWQPPPPPPLPAQATPAQASPPPPPPPPPQAPPFPYQLIGRLSQTGQVQALLGSDQRSLAVKAGDTIDGQWRVQSIGDDSLELLWLPGPLSQTLRFKPL